MELLKTFADVNLVPGRRYPGVRKANCPAPEGFVLKYMDGTACSASHAFCDVFYNESTGKYLVVTDVGQVQSMGECSSEYAHLHHKECDTLCDVLNEVASYSFHDSNETGDFALHLGFIDADPHGHRPIYRDFNNFPAWFEQQDEVNKKKITEISNELLEDYSTKVF